MAERSLTDETSRPARLPKRPGVRRSPARRGLFQRGQAMVLGALSMLILTMGVLATVNLGYAIHKRIRLQNTLDSRGHFSI